MTQHPGDLPRTPWTELTDPTELVSLVGEPSVRARTKERCRLTEIDRAWLAASPFCMVATADAEGRADCSPKGDPPGSMVHVLDETRIVLPERPGNRRLDGYRNILENPYVGLNFLVPRRGDTLRINGRARIVAEADFFEVLAVKGQRPLLAMVVEIETLFYHCAKAFLRSQLWAPESWTRAEDLPDRARIAGELEPVPGETREERERYYAPENYGRTLY